MGESALRLECRDGVGWIILDRPGVLNAVNDEIRSGLPQAIGRMDDDADVRIIVIRSACERAFSVGADIKEERSPETPAEARERLTRRAWIESVARTAKPVIAAINGFCLGGGLELAMACDLRIASTDASFALPEINLGLLPGGGGTQRLARLIGVGRAIDMMLTGDRIGAERALELGLVTRLSAPDALLAETESLAGRLAQKPAYALRLIKEAVLAGTDLPMSEGLRLERSLFTLLLSTEDKAEAAAAFRDKCGPRLVGG